MVPTESVAVTVIDVVATAFGVPEMTPVLELIVAQVGSFVALQEYGAVPPVA